MIYCFWKHCEEREHIFVPTGIVRINGKRVRVDDEGVIDAKYVKCAICGKEEMRWIKRIK